MPETEHDLDLSLSRTFVMQDNGLLVPADTDEDAPSAPPLIPGAVIDSKYKVISLLGEGGMGSVYLAHHLLLDKDMALKTFGSRRRDRDASRRFGLEVRAIAKLSHKNIVQVFDFGTTADGWPFYTMELLDGSSLVKYIAQRSLSLRETLEVFQAVADGLAHAHRAGIIHRDIKPDNIHLGAPQGEAGKISSVKIVDFGIAKLILEGSADGTADDSSQEQQSITKGGRVFGSPLYMSPEQSMGLPTDHRSDIYSFGCTLFEAIAGKPPFIGESSTATLSCHRLDTPPTLTQRAPDKVFPQRLEALLVRLLKKDKNDRFQSAVEVRQEIARILANLPERSVMEEATIAQKAETSLRSDRAEPVQDDGHRETDRGLLHILSSKRRLILPASLVAILALATAVVWSSAKNTWSGGPLQKNNLPSSTAVAEGSEPSDPVAVPGISKGLLKKFLVRQTPESKIFQFPPGESLGRLRFDEREAQASGQVVVPKHCDCTLIADSRLAQTPELFDGFGPDDLTELRFNPLAFWKDRNIKWVSHLTGLQKLDLENCDLTAASIEYLNNLIHLRSIAFDGLRIEAAQWCQLRQLSTLTEIKIKGLQNCSALLTKLKQKNALQSLEIRVSDLSDSAMPKIASFKGLTRLTMTGNTVTTRGLKALLALPKLSHLVINDSNVGPDSIETLAALPALHELQIQTADWGWRNQQRLRAVMTAKKVDLKQTLPTRRGL